ncbi:hypothetical protein PA10_00055 [Pseudomonas phage pPa_SNUABM_DT01]|nr:hypothetical protein PA10_00055 [Pseudomonas phage pPa_SNUABM_DT01]
MSSHPYKDNQRLYNQLVRDHTDDFELMEMVESEEKIENALHYFKEATFPLYYPAKSYSVAIIYAYKLNELFGIDIYETLRDEDLFLGQDPYFVTYDQDQATYDAIIERLKEIPDWINSGWAPQTVRYCLLECTDEGIISVNGA